MAIHLVAMGGGGFSMDPTENTRLDRFVLGLTGKHRPKVCFVGTASGDAQSYIDKYYAAFKDLPCEPTHLSLFKGDTPLIREKILEQDVIYVGGGNTKNLITLWRDWGVDRFIREAHERGTVLAGISAGMICWFEQGITDSVPGPLSALPCLGWFKGSACPHYDGEATRRPRFHAMLESGEIGAGYAADDSAALHFVDGVLKEAVCSVAGKSAYWLSLKDGKACEEKIQARLLEG